MVLQASSLLQSLGIIASFTFQLAKKVQTVTKLGPQHFSKVAPDESMTNGQKFENMLWHRRS